MVSATKRVVERGKCYAVRVKAVGLSYLDAVEWLLESAVNGDSKYFLYRSAWFDWERSLEDQRRICYEHYSFKDVNAGDVTPYVQRAKYNEEDLAAKDWYVAVEVV
jgi:hypothetical protein